MENPTTIMNRESDGISVTKTNELITQLLSEMGKLREVVAQQQAKINQLETQQTLILTNNSTPLLNTTSSLNRRRLLRGLAAGLALGTGTTVALTSAEKTAQAKLNISPIAAIGALVTPPGSANHTGQPLEPANKYGVVGVSDTTAFNLNKLPEVASCGVIGYTSSGAGVYGKAADGWGVRGEGSTTGFGVSGTAAGNGVGVAGGSETGIGVLAQSGTGIPFQIASSDAPPSLEMGNSGSFYVNSTNNKLFVSKNGAWKEILTEA